MNPAIKEQWCRALESGVYIQGTANLSRDNHYCCLGVLCEILHIPATLSEDGRTTRYGDNSAALPKSAIDAAGLTEANPRFTHKDYEEETLAELNDSGATFSEIASIIRTCF